jgi:cell division inhibitor SepF
MGFLQSVKNFIGIDTEEYDDYEDYEDYEEEEVVEAAEKPQHTAPQNASFTRKSNKVVPLGGSGTSKIIIVKPNNFDDSTDIADELKARRPVIFDVGTLEAEEARRIVDFIAGAVYGVDGNIRRVSGGIFVAAPAHIDITGDAFKEQTRGSFDWNMFN